MVGTLMNSPSDRPLVRPTVRPSESMGVRLAGDRAGKRLAGVLEVWDGGWRAYGRAGDWQRLVQKGFRKGLIW